MATISKADVQATADETGWPVIMTLKEAAAASRMAPQTLKRHVSEGRFKNSVKRGKPLLFWRDKFIPEVMKGTWA